MYVCTRNIKPILHTKYSKNFPEMNVKLMCIYVKGLCNVFFKETTKWFRIDAMYLWSSQCSHMSSLHIWNFLNSLLFFLFCHFWNSLLISSSTVMWHILSMWNVSTKSKHNRIDCCTWVLFCCCQKSGIIVTTTNYRCHWDTTFRVQLTQIHQNHPTIWCSCETLPAAATATAIKIATKADLL